MAATAAVAAGEGAAAVAARVHAVGCCRHLPLTPRAVAEQVLLGGCGGGALLEASLEAVELRPSAMRSPLFY